MQQKTKVHWGDILKSYDAQEGIWMYEACGVGENPASWKTHIQS